MGFRMQLILIIAIVIFQEVRKNKDFRGKLRIVFEMKLKIGKGKSTLVSY